MSAFVIDAKKKRQYLAVFAVSLIISFALGFTSGYFANLSPESQSYDQLKSKFLSESTSDDSAASKQTDEPDAGSPDEQPSAENDGAEQPSDTKEVKEDQPVKKAETGAAKKAAATPARSAAPVTASKPAAPKAPVKTVAESKPEVRKAVTPAPKPKPAPKTFSQSSPIAPPTPRKQSEPESEPAPTSEQPALAQASEQSARASGPGSENSSLPMRPPAVIQAAAEDDKPSQYFAVQVGMFANRDNAQKLVYELLDKGYDAYMDAFKSSSGELKYNVRFGRYPNRASVQGRLADYKREYSTPAYVIITR